MAAATRDTQAEQGYIHANPPPGAQGLAFGPDVTPEIYKKLRHEVVDNKVITFTDARTLPGGLAGLTLDTNGIQVFEAPPPLDFDNLTPKEIKEAYYPQLVEIAKKITGATFGYCYNHAIRYETVDPKNVGMAYSRFAHTDASYLSVPEWKRRLTGKCGFSEEEAENCEILMVNIWHPRDRPAYRDPLCLLDVSTVDQGGVYPMSTEVSKIPYRDFESSLVGPTYSPKHRWVFISDQKPEEAWIFKQFDTREGGTKASFHNSFHDPFYDNKPDTPGRRSIEFRMLLTFPKGAKAPPSRL